MSPAIISKIAFHNLSKGNMSKISNLIVGLAGGAAIGVGLVEASVVTGVTSVVSNEATTYATAFGAVIGAVVGLFKSKNRSGKEQVAPSQQQKEGPLE